MICCPLSKYFVAGETEGDDTVLRMRKIKLNPTRHQKLLLRKFADGARFSYNEAVTRVNSGEQRVNRLELRNAIVTQKGNSFFQDKPWLLETPKVIRQQAVFEAVKNFKAAFSNKKAGNIEKFRMTFKSKKKSKGTFVLGVEKNIRIKDGKLHILPSILGEMRHYDKLPFSNTPECDSYIRRDALGNHWLMAPFRRPVTRKDTCDTRPVVSIDPGARNFLTCYSTCGDGFTLGKDMVARLLCTLQRIGGIDSALSKTMKAKDQRRLRRLKMVLYQKYANVRDEYHWKLSNFLSTHFGAVLLPHLETKALAGKLRPKTNRELHASSHWLFSRRLRDKCLEKDVVFSQPHEHFTTKTCGRCGTLNHSVGSSEVFTCPCGVVSHRDLHAARNILLKHLHSCELPPAILREIDAYEGA